MARALAGLAAWLCVALTATRVAAQFDLPDAPAAPSIFVTAESGFAWKQGSYDVWVLTRPSVAHGRSTASAQQGVLWITQADGQPQRVVAYLEGDVRLDRPETPGAPRLEDSWWYGRFAAERSVQVHVPTVVDRPAALPAIYQRAVARRDPEILPAQFVEGGALPAVAPPPAVALPTTDMPAPIVAPAAAGRRILAFPRSEVPVQAQWFPDPATRQWIAVIDSGVNLVVSGLATFDKIDVAADRVVIWTAGLEEPDLSGKRAQAEDAPLELYLEGNIEFRQASRLIRAKRMYYDVRRRVGTIIDADLLTPVPNYDGLLRLRSELVQQVGENRFLARNSYLTSSRLGEPRYRLQAGDVAFEEVPRPVVEGWSGQPVLDPVSGEPLVENRRLATGSNGFLFVGDLPVFYWPFFASDVTDPSFYVRRVRIGNDTIFGTRVQVDLNAYEVFGIRNRPAGTEWDLSLDYFGERGFGHGTRFSYNRNELFDIVGPARGDIDFYGIYDNGYDNLGGYRSNLEPEVDYRYRLLAHHRQQLPGDFQLTAEAALLSDRNFYESFFKNEWDTLKDPTTGVELKHFDENRSWALSVDARVNSFFTQTDNLPRFDHFWLGQPLLNDAFTWFEHSQASYSRMRLGSEPVDPDDRSRFARLPWEAQVDGERFITRHELDWPFQAGVVKVVPYALGELGHWGADIAGEDIQRAYGQAGVRASVPVWRVDPAAESTLWNVHGLAHKVTFTSDLFVAEASKSLDRFPLYEPLDDESIEQFRRHFAFETFGQPIVGPLDPTPFTTSVPPQLDARSVALRRNLGGLVTSPSTEIADDLVAARLGIEQRWQTKRGMPGNRQIVDWISFDTHATLFPDDDRDNFGRLVGLADYAFRWNVGNDLLLTSDGTTDFFDNAGSVFNVGGYIIRPPRGSLFLGFSLLTGPVEAQLVNASYSYWMSPKWISTLGFSYDLVRSNIGQYFTVTRVGESFLVSAGFSVDAIRGVSGINFMIEPRGMRTGRLGAVGGGRVPAPGARGLE